MKVAEDSRGKYGEVHTSGGEGDGGGVEEGLGGRGAVDGEEAAGQSENNKALGRAPSGRLLLKLQQLLHFYTRQDQSNCLVAVF